MCKLKSAIILKNRVFIPDYDSHSDMLEELKIADTRENAERLFVRAELSPSDDDVFSPIDTWVFTVDQDIRPDWFVEEVDKARMVDAVKGWAKDRIHVGVDDLKIDSGAGHYIKDCENVEISNSTVKACGNSTVKACGNSAVKAFNNSTVEAFDNSTVAACGNSTVEAHGNSTVKAYGNSTVEAYDNSTVKACGNSTVTACGNSAVKAFNNSTVKACDNSTVEAYGNSTVEAYGNSTVKAFNNSTVKACDNSTVTAYGNSTVEAYGNSTVVKTQYSVFSVNRLKLFQNATFKDCEARVIYQSGDWEFRPVIGSIKADGE